MFPDGADIACRLAVPSVGVAVDWSLIWSDEPDAVAAVDVPWAADQPLLLDEEESLHIGVCSGHLYAALAGPLPAGQERGPRGVIVLLDVTR